MTIVFFKLFNVLVKDIFIDAIVRVTPFNRMEQAKF